MLLKSTATDVKPLLLRSSFNLLYSFTLHNKGCTLEFHRNFRSDNGTIES